ncbi:vegetative cell wall protein gp1-like [Camellia sinensis]|uniref:vegetative cell wall protein gp1-like n=1 Tax=Camellia sinensis TaxID=4442 RepID=UPI0010365E21|nr:vegetative cell wall protein gp1-like [Camellia sinensis]
MGRKRKPDHPRRMISDVLHNRTLVAPPSEEASHWPPSEGPLVPPPSEGPLVPPYRPPSVAPQQLPCTQPPRLPSVRPPSVAPQQLSSSAYEPSADPSTSSQPTSGLFDMICIHNI